MNPVYSSIIEQVTEQERHRANIYRRPESLHKSISAFMPRDIRNFALLEPLKSPTAHLLAAKKKKAMIPDVEYLTCRECKQAMEADNFNKHGKDRKGNIRYDRDCRSCSNILRRGKK